MAQNGEERLKIRSVWSCPKFYFREVALEIERKSSRLYKKEVGQQGSVGTLFATSQKESKNKLTW